jgi:putative DNA primase/helicase
MDTADGTPDNTADESRIPESIIAKAKALTKGDHAGAKAVIGDAILADLDPVTAGVLFNTIKTSAGISISAVRKQFEKMAGARKTTSKAERRLPFAVYEPAATPRPLDELLDEVAGFVRARVSCPENEITVVALWSVATYGVREGFLPGQEANTVPGPSKFPRLRVGSGGPDSGKTTLMESLSYIAARAVSADSISASSFFRLVDKYQPTLFLDETDAWVNGNESVRKVIDSGHRRAGQIIISAKDAGDEDSDWEPTIFRTFAPAAIAGLGALAATIESRCIKIIASRQAGFVGEYFTDPDMIAFRDRISPHLAAHGDAMAAAMAKGVDRKKMLALGLDNRAADNWQPLLAVAKLASRVWLRRGLKAAIELGGDPKNARPLAKPEHLLADLHAYHRALVLARWDGGAAGRAARRKANGRGGQFSQPVPGIDVPREMLSTSDFIAWLTTTPGYASPWAEGARRDARGRLVGEVTPHAIAKVMRSFRVPPTRRNIWANKRNETVRGYLVADLRPLWAAHGSRNGHG